MKIMMWIAGGFMVAGFLSGCGNDNTPSAYEGWIAGSNVDGYGTILHTADSGKTWERTGDPTSIPDAYINDVDAPDAFHVWAVGQNSVGPDHGSFATILFSDTQGKTWVRQGSSASMPDTELAGVSAVDGMRVWCVGSGGTILYTDNGGETWQQQAEGQFASVSFQMASAADTTHVWAVGTDENSGTAIVVKSSDGGTHWQRVDLAILAGVEGLIDVHAVTPDIIWAVGTGGTVLLTVNGGETWVRTGPPAGLLHVNGVCALDAKRAWIAVDSYNVYFTSDGGFTWTQQHLASGDTVGLSGAYMGVTAVNARTAWLVGLNSPQMEEKPVILHTTDGGDAWAPQSSPANAYLRRVSFVGDVR